MENKPAYTLALATIGIFLLANPAVAAKAWTDAEKAECAGQATEEGQVCIPLGRDSMGNLGCNCHFTSTEHQANSIARSKERGRKQDEEWARKGGKPDPSNGNKPKWGWPWQNSWR